MRKGNRSKGLVLSFFLFISAILSVLVIPLPIAKAAPSSSWSTFTIAASGDDTVLLANSTWSNYTTNGDNLWAHSNEYTTYSWLRFEGLGAITDAGGIIDQIILSMYSGDDEGADYEEVAGGYVSVSAPMYNWNFELSQANILAADMNPIASFDGDNLSPSGAWYNKTISNSDPREWYSWSSNFGDVFICSVTGFMQYAPDSTYYRSFTSQDEGHPAKLYVKYHIGTGYEEVLDYFGVDTAIWVGDWNNYNIWAIEVISDTSMSVYWSGGSATPTYYHTTYARGVVDGTDWDNITKTGDYDVGYPNTDTIAKVGDTTIIMVDWGQVQLWYSHDEGTNWAGMILNDQYTYLENHSSSGVGSMSVDTNGTVHMTWATKTDTSPGDQVQVYSNFTIDTSETFNFYDGFTEWTDDFDYENIEADRYGRVHISTILDGDLKYYIRFINGSWNSAITIETSDTLLYTNVDVADMPGDFPRVRFVYSRQWVGVEDIYQTIRDPDGTLTDSLLKGTNTFYPSSAMDMDGNVSWAVWTDIVGSNPQIEMRGYNFTTETLMAEQSISRTDQKHRRPDIGISQDGSGYIVWWSAWTLDYMGRSFYLNGTLGAAQTEIVDHEGGVDAYIQIAPVGDEFSTGYVVTAPNGTVITPDPFEDLEDAEDWLEDWDEDYGPVLAISIANIEAVEWVFEGRERYEFTVEYINVNLTDIDQVGVGFTDETNQFHNVWYDRDANTLTVTSPDECISGWLSSIEQTSTNVTAIFHIMFNSPIPDSFDVSAYGRIVDTSDSGWVTPEWGEAGESGDPYLFNIYNLGGLSTLTASGTAGRMTGGDVFEIYAADTRTNIAGTQYFDVRDAPLSWYNVLTNEDLLINEMPPEWEFNIPRREEATTIRLTNNLPQDRVGRDYDTSGTDDMAYVSYPFSMRLLSDPYLTGDYQVGAELEFPRTLTTADEVLNVQAYMMNPNSSQTTGAFRLRDGSRLTSGSKILADVQFAGNGSWASYNSTLAGWYFYGNYTAYDWYNVTMAVNLTGAVYDVYIDDELKFSDMPYRIVSATTALIVEFTQFVNPYGSGDDFLDLYVDNVRQWTSFDANYGGIAKATTLFKQLQHWSMDFDFFIENGEEYAQGPTATPSIANDDYSDYGYIELGWDVMINETWVNDFLVARVNITDGRIAGKNDWVKFNVSWYSQGSYVKNDMLYGLFEGYSLFPGSAKDTTGFHWDMWFNRANASTVIGARINTEYFGMSDKSVWWAVWSSKWQPMRTEVSDSTIFVNLQNAGLVTQSVKDVLFVRSWVEVYRNSESTFAYKILNIDGLDFLVAIETMSGIDTPPVRETKVPDIVSGFLGSSLGSIFSAALKRLGNAMAGFGMDFFTLSIDFMDNVFAALGYPALVSTIFGWMDSLFASVPILVGLGITLIGQIFRLINTSAGNTLTQLTGIITIWVGMYSTTMDLLTGVLTPGLNIWNDLGINSFIQIGAVLYPFWLIMMGMEKGTQAVFDHLNSVLNIGSFFLNFILNVGGFFMGLMDMLIGAIRG